MGKFYVTVMTYTYSHVVRVILCHLHFLAQYLFILKKTFESYHYFFSTLLKLEPKNESMNNVAKAHVDYCKSTWVELELVNNMYDLVTEQMKEVGEAVIGMGEYQFKLAYSHLEVPGWIVFRQH